MISHPVSPNTLSSGEVRQLATAKSRYGPYIGEICLFLVLIDTTNRHKVTQSGLNIAAADSSGCILRYNIAETSGVTDQTKKHLTG